MNHRLFVFYENVRVWCIEHKQDIGLVFIIVLIASLSFGLGYLANRESTHAPIVIEQYSSSTSP